MYLPPSSMCTHTPLIPFIKPTSMYFLCHVPCLSGLFPRPWEGNPVSFRGRADVVIIIAKCFFLALHHASLCLIIRAGNRDHSSDTVIIRNYWRALGTKPSVVWWDLVEGLTLHHLVFFRLLADVRSASINLVLIISDSPTHFNLV